jgi:hypothetical protein
MVLVALKNPCFPFPYIKYLTPKIMWTSQFCLTLLKCFLVLLWLTFTDGEVHLIQIKQATLGVNSSWRIPWCQVALFKLLFSHPLAGKTWSKPHGFHATCMLNWHIQPSYEGSKLNMFSLENNTMESCANIWLAYRSKRRREERSCLTKNVFFSVSTNQRRQWEDVIAY